VVPFRPLGDDLDGLADLDVTFNPTACCFSSHVRSGGKMLGLSCARLIATTAIYALPVSHLGARADDLGDVQKRLSLIYDAADHICGVVKAEGNSLAAKGEVRAQLSGLIAKLADVGGSAGLDKESYTGVLQADAAKSIAHNEDCRQNIYNSLQPVLLTPGPRGSAGGRPSANANPPRPGPSPQAGAAKIISVGAVSIGDTISSVRSSGVQGQWSVNAGKTTLTSPISANIGDPQNYMTKQGSAVYEFDHQMVNKITVTINQDGICSDLQWPDRLVSDTIAELGEPVQGPTDSRNVETIQGHTLIELGKIFMFSTDGENRKVSLIDVSPQTGPRKVCFFIAEYWKQ
jgi:hypothetical protein